MSENIPDATTTPSQPAGPLSIEERISAAIAPAEAPAVAPAEAAHEPEDLAAATDPEASAEDAEGGADIDEAEAHAGDGQPDEIVIGERLEDLANHLGIDVADLYGVQMPFDVDGKPAVVSLGEMKDAYRESVKIAQEREQITALQRQVEQQRAEATERVRADLLQSAALLERQKNAFLSEFDGEDWNALRADDPAAWAARRQEFAERQRDLEASRAEVEQAYNNFNVEQQAAARAQLEEAARLERHALLQALPQWQNEETFRAEAKALNDYLVSSGFTADEVNNTIDHRLIVMARKAQQFDQREQTANPTKQKVIKIAKRTASPGSAAARGSERTERVQALRTSLRKSGRVEDAAAVIRAQLDRT